MEAVTLAYDLFEPDDILDEANPIILTHGLFWSKFMLKELGRALCKETKRKVYSIDMRNHDESPSCDKCDITLITEDVKKFLRDHNIEKATFICHSFSCPMAYLIAMEQPEKVEKLVMIDHPPCTDEMRKESVMAQFNSQNRFLRSLDPKMSLMEAKRKILNLAAMPSIIKSQELFLRKVAHDLDKDGQTFKWKTDIEFLKDRYLDKSLLVKPRGRCEHEILIVICPNSTRVSEESFMEILKYSPNAKLEIMEGTTHLLMLEKTDTFVKIVKQFLDS